MNYRLLFPVLLAIALIALSGCRAAECEQMLECCSQVEELDGLGGACADLATDTRDPQTCRTVVRTIGYMLDEREDPRPESCQL